MEDYNYFKKLLIEFGPDLQIPDVLFEVEEEILSIFKNNYLEDKIFELVDMYTDYYEEIALRAFISGFILCEKINREKEEYEFFERQQKPAV